MKIKFHIDMEYDLDMVLYMLSGDDWEYRAKRMDLPKDLVKKIHESSDDDLDKYSEELKTVILGKYKELDKYMTMSMENYRKSWNEIITKFSNLIEDKTTTWFYDEYICNITHYNMGLSNWGGNVVGRWWKENLYLQRRITAHEILLAHYFSIHRNNYKDSGLSDKQIWALAEISSFALTGLDKDIKNFWPWDTTGYYKNHNYPYIVDLQTALEKPFLERKSFDEYVQKGIELVKEMYNPEGA